MTTLTSMTARAVLMGALSIGACTMLAAAPSALADPKPPNCTAADLAQVTTGVSAAMSVYLFTHPDVNAFLTDLEGAPRDTVRARVDEYMTANPQVQAELAGIRQPLVDLRSRCGGAGEDEA